MIFVTGGAGFIGSNFIRDWLGLQDEPVLNFDALTYAGNHASLDNFSNDDRYRFVHGNISDRKTIGELCKSYTPRAIINFAAESHVDRSIDSPIEFLETNVVGTFHLLESVRSYLTAHPSIAAEFRFLHVSTDEVYGSLGESDPAFSETTAYAPNSAYSASKAASDHFVRAWHHTYKLPVLTTNCSNNYGPYQYPEKLIPLVITNALNGTALPIYGDGLNVRDWLYVKDHCHAIRTVLEKGTIGQTYNIGGCNEMQNIDLVRTICRLLDKKKPRKDGQPYERQIKFVTDRAGHDRRYAIDSTKIEKELNWRPKDTFESGIEKTIDWYLENEQWTRGVSDQSTMSSASVDTTAAATNIKTAQVSEGTTESA